jgi:hypothetical protein
MTLPWGAVAREGLAPVGADASARRLGLLDGKIRVPEDFDDPLPDEILAEFEGLTGPARVYGRFG